MATATFNTAIEAPIGEDNIYDLDSIITTDIVFDKGKTYKFDKEPNLNISLKENLLTLSEGAYGPVEILVSSDITETAVATTKVSGFQAGKNEYMDNATLQTNFSDTQKNWSSIISRTPIKGGEAGPKPPFNKSDK
jgi:hypothetical protein